MGVIDIALSQEGTKESGVNNVKYNTWYYGKVVSGNDYPWCAVFVSWCCNEAGSINAIGGKKASVSDLLSFFKSQNRFQPKGNGYKPQPGDVMIQKDGGASHTGFVYKSTDSLFYTIEGNAGDAVTKRSYKYDDYRLTGFGVPSYNNNPLTGSTGSLSSSGDDLDNTGSGGTNTGGSLGIGSYDYTDYTVKKGDTIQSIAKKFKCTPAMIQFVNNLKSLDVKPGDKLKVPTAEGVQSNPSKNVGTITTKHTTRVEVSHPVIEIEFYTEIGMLATVSTEGIPAGSDMDNDIISCNTVRSMGQDCPTMTISLVQRRNWYKILSSNDLVIVRMQRPPEDKTVVFIGLIDDIRRTLDFSSGQPQRAIQVTCRGLNKVFVNFDVGLLENISVQSESGFFHNLLSLTGCNSGEAIQLIWDAYVGKGINYIFSNKKPITKYIKYVSTKPHPNERLGDYTSYASYSGSLWNFIKELSNVPFNETFWETKGEKARLIHRRTPFNKKDWVKLPRTTIKDYDIVSNSTGRSDLETYTVYIVNLTFLGEDTRNLYCPLWYPPFYSKYGITQLTVNSNFEARDASLSAGDAAATATTISNGDEEEPNDGEMKTR